MVDGPVNTTAGVKAIPEAPDVVIFDATNTLVAELTVRLVKGAPVPTEEHPTSTRPRDRVLSVFALVLGLGGMYCMNRFLPASAG